MDRRLTSRLERSPFLPMAIFGLATLLAVAVVAIGAFRGMQQLAAMDSHLESLQDLQRLNLELQGALQGSRVPVAVIDPQRLRAAERFVDRLIELGVYQEDATLEQLVEARVLFTRLRSDPAASGLALLDLTRRISEAEQAAHEELVARTRSRLRRDLTLASAIGLTLPVAAAFWLGFLQRRVWRPLLRLETLLGLLEQRQYRSAEIESAAPFLRPVIERFNSVVVRLEDLEQESRDRERELSRQVARATRAVVEQRDELARLERLAAVGELAASVAHELRNPLAGVLVLLQRLERSLESGTASDAAQIAKLEQARTELERMAALLRDILGRARSEPEPSRPVALSGLLEEVGDLARLQLPEGVGLEVVAPADVVVELPEGGLRRALFNLLLNSAQALEEEARDAARSCAGRIRLSAALEGGGLIVEVRDDGPGFPEVLLQEGPRAFASLRDGGTGLGLASVRRFARDLGGELELANAPSGGAVARLRLPTPRGAGGQAPMREEDADA